MHQDRRTAKHLDAPIATCRTVVGLCEKLLPNCSLCNIFATYLQHLCNILATSWQHLCNILATSLQHMCNIFAASLRYFCKDVAKMLLSDYFAFGPPAREGQAPERAVLAPGGLQNGWFWSGRAPERAVLAPGGLQNGDC